MIRVHFLILFQFVGFGFFFQSNCTEIISHILKVSYKNKYVFVLVLL